MAVFVVEFSHGLAPPFMEISAVKPERNREKLEGKPHCLSVKPKTPAAELAGRVHQDNH